MSATMTQQQVNLRADLLDLVTGLKVLYPGLVLTYRWLDHTTIHLDVIALPKQDRNSGIGTDVMTELVGYAAANRVRIMLVPDNCFGSDLLRLRNFYRRFGFQPEPRRSRFVYNPA